MREHRGAALPRRVSDAKRTRHMPSAAGYGSALENRAMAESILQHARRAGLYAHDSPDLIAVLMGVDLDRRIPRELYNTVASLLVWLHDIDNTPRV